jgi:hypothetical protein
MAEIHVCQLSEIVSSLPEPCPFNTCQSNRDIQQPALFLCALGFEPRSLVIPERLASSGLRARAAIYFEYSTNRDDNRTNLPQLLQHLGSVSDAVQAMEADEEGFSRRLREILQGATTSEPDKDPEILFDISVAANRLIMRCMKVLLEFDIRLSVLYAEANVYHPTKEEYNRDADRWGSDEGGGLEQGVSDITRSEEYPGYHVDQVPDCVILFPSFRAERALAVISEVDPSLLQVPEKKVIWLLGAPHGEQDRWRLDAMRQINMVQPDSSQAEVSTFDYRESLRTLEGIYRERVLNYRFTLGPMGSKMQALGASLFCYLRPDVRVVFATPKEYNAQLYSDGCKAIWTVEFGPLKKLRALLDRVDTLSIEA